MPRLSSTAHGKIQFYVDLDAIVESIGAGLAFAEVAGMDKSYQSDIMDAAFQQADAEFNIEAAAYGATGAIKHMYEWGTAGINRGRSNMRPDPLTERARLWNSTIEGIGLNKVISYAFKPSFANVPKPTKAETGMSTDVIERMRDHVFQWKAQVMELGMQVTISRQEAKFLLIPYHKGMTNFRPHDKKRGYMLTKGPLYAKPGREVQGNFTAFWTQFWEERGQQAMDLSMQAQIEKDFMADIVVNTPGTLAPAKAGTVTAGVEAEKKKTATRAKAAAKARNTKRGQ